MKATFTLKVKLPIASAGAHVLSNTPLSYTQTVDDGRKLAFVFGVTPVMSVHQLSLVISPDLQSTSKLIGNLNLTVWSPKDIHQAKFAAHVASRALRSVTCTFLVTFADSIAL